VIFGTVRQQVENFLRFARMVDQYDLSDAENKPLVKAYERHRETMGQHSSPTPEAAYPSGSGRVPAHTYLDPTEG
jgi:hypothetical protein